MKLRQMNNAGDYWLVAENDEDRQALELLVDEAVTPEDLSRSLYITLVSEGMPAGPEKVGIRVNSESVKWQKNTNKGE